MSGNTHRLACHFSFGDHGKVGIVEFQSGRFKVLPVSSLAASGLPLERRPVYLHSDAQQCYFFDPIAEQIKTANGIPEDAPAGYAYFPADQSTVWLVNDGDKETGVAALYCKTGSPVTILNGATPQLVKNVCLGKGHHVPAFSLPSAQHPTAPLRAFVSNLLDGSIDVLDNDPAGSNYLHVIDTINLADPKREKTAVSGIPNNAFPHGMVYSPYSGKIYSLNNGYGTVDVIDPASLKIETRVELPSCSNLLLSPDGRYVLGKGADRKSNPDHVMGRLAVLDTQTLLVQAMDLPDTYPSTFKFNAQGDMFFLTTAMTGNDTQKQNIKSNCLLCFQLNEGKLLQAAEISTGHARCGRRPIALFNENGTTRYVFNPDISDGTITVIDAQSLQHIETLDITQKGAKEVTFSFWPREFTGT